MHMKRDVRGCLYQRGRANTAICKTVWKKWYACNRDKKNETAMCKIEQQCTVHSISLTLLELAPNMWLNPIFCTVLKEGCVAHADNIQSQRSSYRKKNNTNTNRDYGTFKQSFLLFAALIAAAFALLHYRNQWKSAVDTNHELCNNQQTSSGMFGTLILLCTGATRAG